LSPSSSSFFQLVAQFLEALLDAFELLGAALYSAKAFFRSSRSQRLRLLVPVC